MNTMDGGGSVADGTKRETMRLDRYLSLCGVASRSETARAVRHGEVMIDGITVRRSDCPVDPDGDTVIFRGKPVVYRRYTYVMLYKPDGVVSATEDRLAGERTVLDLLPPELLRVRPGLFPCGRLDKHTTGLMLLSNNGQLAHRLLSPARHVDKAYVFTVKFPLSDEDISALQAGVPISARDGETGYVTAPCRIDITGVRDGRMTGRITLHEGKYHQIKRMMEARHNQVTALSRVAFGPLTLDPNLEPGEWRLLTDEEREELEACGGTPDQP